MNRRIFVKIVLGLGLSAGVWVLIRHGYIDVGGMAPAKLHDHIHSFGNLAVIVFMGVYILNTMSMVVPVTPLGLTSGLAFGAGPGAAYLMVAMMSGSTASFLISRVFGRGLIEKRLRGELGKIDKKIERNGFKTVLFLRLIPVVPFGVFNYLCGLSKIKYGAYCAATFLGIIPSVIIVSFFGDSLGKIARTGDVFSYQFVLATLLLALRVSVPLVYQYAETHRKNKRSGIRTGTRV